MISAFFVLAGIGYLLFRGSAEVFKPRYPGIKDVEGRSRDIINHGKEYVDKKHHNGGYL